MNVTASGQTRFRACPPSSFLSSVSSSNEWAERGTEGHLLLDRLARGMSFDEAAAACDPEHMPLYRSIDYKAVFAGLQDIKTEMAWAIDLETRKVRFIGQDIGREYGPRGKWDLVGSCDLMAKRTSDGAQVVRDWKFGKFEGPASLQNMFFAAVCILNGADGVVSQICAFEAEGPRMGSHDIFEIDIGPFDVEAYLDESWEAAKRADADERHWRETGSVSVKMGDWCDYCGAKAAGSCPAYAGLAKAMVMDLTTLADRVAALTPEQAGVAWLKYKEAERLIEIIGKGLKGICSDDSPLPLPDGREVRPSTQSKSSLNRDMLLELAQRLGASAADINACYTKTSYPVYRIRKKGS